MVTPKILNLDGTEQYLPKKKPTIRYLIAGRLKFSKYFLKMRNEYTMQDYVMKEPVDIDFSTGCFSIIRTDVFKEIKGFDNRFFMYFEDVDLTLRAKRYGRIIFNPKIYATHGWERSSAKKLKFLLIHINSMIKFFWKWKNKK
jgi:GT2 family glycosyltransferase